MDKEAREKIAEARLTYIILNWRDNLDNTMMTPQELAQTLMKVLIEEFGYRRLPKEWTEMVGWLIDRGWIPPEEAQNYILKPPDRPELKEFTAWTIDTRSTEGHGLLGRYFFANNIPPSAEGCVTALFKTREIARQYCKEKFKDYTPSTWKPKVIKVKVIVLKADQILALIPDIPKDKPPIELTPSLTFELEGTIPEFQDRLAWLLNYASAMGDYGDPDGILAVISPQSGEVLVKESDSPSPMGYME